MTDITERLRALARVWQPYDFAKDLSLAADEIDRLRSDMQDVKQKAIDHRAKTEAELERLRKIALASGRSV